MHFNGNNYQIDTESIVLYHGSKYGIDGEIRPISRELCDFGRGFYMGKDCDVIIGYIANDRMFFVLDRFFSGEITDVALVQSLSVLKLGKQYVAITKKACKQIKITNEKAIGATELKDLQKVSGLNRREGIAKADEICRKYRREGRFFDEIIEGAHDK